MFFKDVKVLGLDVLETVPELLANFAENNHESLFRIQDVSSLIKENVFNKTKKILRWKMPEVLFICEQ